MDHKTIFLMSIIMLFLAMGVVSASDMNDTQISALYDASNFEEVDINQELGEYGGIDIVGPKELLYEYNNRFEINVGENLGEGTVCSYVNNVSGNWENIGGDEAGTVPLYIEIKEPGTYDIDFKFLKNGDYTNIKSFHYVADRFDASITTNTAVNSEDLYFNVYLPYDASGKVDVKVKDKIYSADKVQGIGYVDFSGYENDLGIGKIPALINFTADSKSKYKSQTTESHLIIYPAVTVDWQARYASEDGIEVYAMGLMGKFTYKIDGESKTVDVNGSAKIVFPKMDLGQHKLEYNYTFDDFGYVMEQNLFEVIPNFDVPSFVKKGTPASMNVTLPDNVSGNLIINLNGNDIYSNGDAKGILIIDLTNLRKFNDLYVNYTDATSSFEWTFNPVCTSNSPEWDMKIDADSFIDVAGFSNNYFGINVPDDYDGEIAVLIDGKEVSSAVFSTRPVYLWNGTAFVDFNSYSYYFFNVEKLPIGVHTMTVIGKNSQYYQLVNRTVEFTATNLNVNLDDEILYKYQDWSVDVPVDSTGSVKFYLDEKLIDTQKGSSLVFKIPDNTKFGQHTLKFVFSGDKKYPKETLTKKVDYTYQIFPRYKNWIFFNEKSEFAEGNKNILVFEGPSDFTGKMSITINGETLTKTVKKGYVEFDISKFKTGNYTAKVEYPASGKFPKQSYSMDLEILPKLVNIKADNMNVYYDAGLSYTVKVTNVNGSAADNVPVSFYINGVDYEKKTDSKGVVKFAIKENPGTYTAVVRCKHSEVSKKVTVKHVVSLAGAKVKKSAKKLTLTATLKNGKTPLKNKQVTFKFNGKTYKAKTNSKGVAKVTVKSAVLKKLKVGKKITYQATYKKDTVKKTVKVLK